MTNSISLDNSGSERFDVPKLIAYAQRGIIRVPSFQRGFVWTDADVRTLLDSIYRGFPVGTILLWRNAAPAGTVNFSSISVDVPERSDALWVVDGQQRVTSLFATLSAEVETDDDRFNVLFDLEREVFVGQKRGLVPPRTIPIRGVYDGQRLFHWLRENGDDLEPEDFSTAERLAGRIRDYMVPAYVVAGENQRTLREVFDRVNSAGKPISRAQVFHALFAGDEESSSPAAVVAELRAEHFGAIEENRVVQSLLAIRGGDVQRDLHDEFGEEEKPDYWYDRTTDALARTIAFLKKEGVPHMQLVPNTMPIPVLATFFHLHPEPEPWTERLLSRWLWRGWVHGFGRESGQTPTMRRAIRSVHPRRGEPDQAPSEYEAVQALLNYTPDRDAPELPLTNFKTNFANSRLILLALASLQPLNADGSKVDLSALLDEYGVDSIVEIVPHARSNAGARAFSPADTLLRREGGNDPQIMRSHLIDAETRNLLVTRSFDKALDRRGSALQDLTTKFLRARLEPGAPSRRSIGDLVARGVGVEDD